MKKQLWLILIAVEVLILFAMLLADFGVIHYIAYNDCCYNFCLYRSI